MPRNEVKGMEALTLALAGAEAPAGVGLEHLCRQSAQKAINEVLEYIFKPHWTRDGYYEARAQFFSEGVMKEVVQRAVDGCTE